MKCAQTPSLCSCQAKRNGRRNTAFALIGVCLSFTLQTSSYAQDEEVKKVFVESELRLPAAAEDKNLLLFHRSETQQFFIDTKSLSIAEDGSFRYTLVAKSKAGAISTSYEGMRCETLEKRLFAFGRKDGSWSESRNHDWTSISSTDSNRHQSVLAWDYVCSYRRIVGNVDNIVQRIRKGESLQRSP